MGSLEVRQRTKDSMFNATALLKQWNESTGMGKKLDHFFENNNTEEFIKVLESEENLHTRNSVYVKSRASRGDNAGTWMHPYLFIKFSMWLNPKFEYHVIKFVYDNLIEFRNQAGDHFVDMVASIKDSYTNYFGKSPQPYVYINESRFLNNLVYGETKGGKRNTLTQDQLDKLNKLQLANIKMINEGLSKTDRHTRLELVSSYIN